MTNEECISEMQTYIEKHKDRHQDLETALLFDAITHAINFMKRFSWQPIASAPRNGTWVLLWSKSGYAIPAFWGYGEDRGHSWFVHSSHGQYAYKSKDKNWFTHWMPLPPAPESEGINNG